MLVDFIGTVASFHPMDHFFLGAEICGKEKEILCL
jgi:hypothetical protein